MHRYIDPMDIYVDPDATSAGYGGNALYMIHRKTVPLETIKENPNYSNVDKIQPGGGADEYMDKLSRYRGNVPEKDKHKELIEILEYWEKDRLMLS